MKPLAILFGACLGLYVTGKVLDLLGNFQRVPARWVEDDDGIQPVDPYLEWLRA